VLLKQHCAGTHRAVPPEQTLRRIEPHFAAMGITRIANISGLDCIGIPVVAVYRPNGRSLSVAQGKGLSLASAKVSGAMEAIESHHAENIERPLFYSTLNQLKGSHSTIDLARIPKGKTRSFSPDRKIHWTMGVDLTRSEQVLVPLDLVHTDYSLPLLPGSGSFPMNSNGLASGNQITEAISHGLCEVVERDACSLFSFADTKEQTQRRIDLSTVSDASCLALLEQLDSAGIAVAVWDVSSDLKIAAFQAEIVEKCVDPGRRMAPSRGSGCHASSGVALVRALTEAAQGRLTMIAGNRDDLPRHSYEKAAEPGSYGATQKLILEDTGRRSFSEVHSFESDDLEKDLSWLRSRLFEAKFDSLVVVDLTLPHFEIPVVRVIVPGLEGIHNAPDWTMGERVRRKLSRG
jgi:YcaO-like protein with predicted kinase domain